MQEFDPIDHHGLGEAETEITPVISAFCSQCNRIVTIQEETEPCPECGNFDLEIRE